MTVPVTIVVPSYRDADWLRAHVPLVLRELERRDVGDELLVVDDGGGSVTDALAGVAPSVRVVEHEENRGFAASIATGVREARHELVFLMNPDVAPRPGFLEPLVRALEDEAVAAAAPFVLLDGERVDAESLARLAWRRGFPVLEPAAKAEALRENRSPSVHPAAFVLGGASLWRRADLLGDGSFDALFEPFYWEDVDRSWRAWRGGRRVVTCADSVVEHHNRGTIGDVVPGELVRAAIEKNRLLFAWKHVDDEERLAEHVTALRARTASAAAREDREQLVWLCLALQQAQEALGARTDSRVGFDELRASSDAGRAD